MQHTREYDQCTDLYNSGMGVCVGSTHIPHSNLLHPRVSIELLPYSPDCIGWSPAPNYITGILQESDIVYHFGEEFPAQSTCRGWDIP